MRFRLTRLVSGCLLALAVSAAFGADEPATGVVRFDINRFEVSGNTLLAAAAVDAAVAPFVGPNRDFGDVQRALEALEARYHALGYKVVTVELPEQELQRGVVLLTVRQTTIGRVSVSGNTVFDEANIRRSLPALREGETPNLDQVSAAVRLANQSPARKITMQLHSGERDGAVDARLDVVDQRAWQAALNLDNTGTAETGVTHVGLRLQHANLFGLDHVASVQYTTTLEKPSRVAVYGAGYHIPLYALGDSLDLFGSYSNVDSGTIAAGLVNLAVSGKGATFGARYNRTLARHGDYASTLQYGFDYKAFKNSVLFSGQDFGNDVTVHPLSLAYLGSLELANGQADVSLTLARNVPGGAHGRTDDFTRARSGAKADFTVLRLAGAFARAFEQDWQLRMLVNGQYASDALIPGEQFGAGGAASVRGFSERAVADDSGLLANAELYTPNLCAAHALWQCRVLAFYDSAYVRRKHALPGELMSTAIASAGLGLRWAIGAGFNLQVDVGHVLRTGATAGTDKNIVHFRTGLQY